MARLLQIAFLALTLASNASLAAAQESGEAAPDPYLAAAVEALTDGDHRFALELLERAAVRGDDPRITYYTAFAREKLGRCDEARRTYQAAVEAGPVRFSAAAQAALEGFDARCVVVLEDVPVVEHGVRRPRRSPTLATTGWVVGTVGALALLFVPVKMAFDREVATQSEEFFKARYDCEISLGTIGDDCDADEVKANPQWSTYERRLRTARQGDIALIVGGATLLGAGIVAVIVGSSRPAIALAPVPGGAAVVWTSRF